LYLDLFHNEENVPLVWESLLTDNQDAYVISNYLNVNHERHFHIDFLFNRTKAYYSQFPFRNGVRKWYHNGSMSFVACDLVDPGTKTRIFVAPNKTYFGERKYRSKLVDEIEQYADIGHISCYDTKGTFLWPHVESPWTMSIDELLKKDRKLVYNYWGYAPPHNAYYQDTFISIYGETIEFGSYNTITEKTYDPLIKGHFILPFSTQGFIKCLKQKGIQLPSFIDYSYDDTADDDVRFKKYIEETKRLLAFSIEKWREFYQENIELLHQNQLWFSLKEYERLDLTMLTSRIS